jgi:hypothetical protein
MQKIAQFVDVYRQQKQSPLVAQSDEAVVAGGALPVGAGPTAHSRGGGRTNKIVFLDTLAQDVGEAMALLRQAGLLAPKQPGEYVRLADVGEALAMVEQAGLVPRSEPDWYLRLQEFTQPIV